jgi:hypothetical protein
MVGSNPAKPRVELCSSAEIGKLLIRGEHCVLNDVFRVSSVADDPKYSPLERSGVSLAKLPKRSLISRPGRDQQFILRSFCITFAERNGSGICTGLNWQGSVGLSCDGRRHPSVSSELTIELIASSHLWISCFLESRNHRVSGKWTTSSLVTRCPC